MLSRLNIKSFFKSRKLQVDILIIFVVLFLFTYITITIYSYYRQSRGTIALTYQLMERSETAIIDEIHNYLKPASVTSIASDLLASRALQLADKQHVIYLLESILKSYPYLNSIYLVDERGNFIQETRFEHAKVMQRMQNELIPAVTHNVTIMINQKIKPLRETWLFKNNKGQVIKRLQFTDKVYQPLSRPWYISANKLIKEYWMGIYQFYRTHQPGLTVAYPIIAKTGERLGVVAADFNLAAINAFLQIHRIRDNDSIFILDSHGKIIAYPSQRKTLEKNQINQTHHVSTIDNKEFIHAYQYFQQSKKQRFIIHFNDQQYICSFTNFSTGFGKKWLLGIVVPIQDFVGTIINTNEHTLFFSLFILCIGIILIILVSKSISRSIVYLAKESDRLRQFQLDKPIELKTHIKEVQILLQSLKSLHSSLQSFSRYVPKDLVKQLIATGEVAKLSSSKKKITLLFSDIEGFTQISEQLPTEQLANYLAIYLSELANVIKLSSGTIDKFIGDAVMAFWGAPVEDENQAIHACHATLLCREKIKALNQQWQRTNLPVFKTRFGIHTGEVIIGNMGSESRLNYTAIGRNVNLAARLEGINKIYKTDIIISQQIYDELPDQFLCRPLDIVKIRGKDKHIVIYQLLAERGYANLEPDEQLVKFAKLTQQAFEFYRQKDFKAALTAYKILANDFPDDFVAKLFIDRCENHGESIH